VRKLLVSMKPRGTALAAVGTAIFSIVALAACGTVGSTTLQSSTSGSSAAANAPAKPAAPSVVLPGFQVLSMSFVSDTDGFALGTVACGSSRCDSLLTSTNGGTTWSQLTAPTTAAPTAPAGTGSVVSCPSGQPCDEQVRFATPEVGYAYDPSLEVTTDGGVHWQPQSAGSISSLEAADGTAVRVANSSSGCSGAQAQVSSASVGTGSWQALPAPAVSQMCPAVLYRQGDRLVLAGYGNPAGGTPATAQIARSSNGGKTWTSGPDSCGGTDGYASAVALAQPDVLVLLCQHQMPLSSGGYGPAWIRVSGNDGATFGADEQVPSLQSASAGTILRYQLAASSSGRVLVTETSPSGSKALLTQNGGQSWSQTLSIPAGNVVLVGYEDTLTGRIAAGNQVWTTRDGGSTWTANEF
jgi:hypothetical protein